MRRIILFFLVFWEATLAFAQQPGDSVLITTTSQDRQSLNLVVYNQNFALVQEVRKVELPFGICNLYLKDIPAKIEPESVVARSLFAPEGFHILSQRYLYHLITPKNLLKHYVGKEIELYYENPATGRKELAKAKLLAYVNNQPICQIGDKVFLHCPGEIILPSLPEGLLSSPTLMWQIDNSAEGEHLIQLSYLVKDISWQANYILNLTQKEAGSLSGWVKIVNQSGGDYTNARVYLMAGRLHEIKSPAPLYKTRTFVSEEAKNVKPSSFFEYRLYTLPRPLNINNEQTTQVQFLDKENIFVKQIFSYQGNSYYYRSYYENPIKGNNVNVDLEIANTKENQLGIPLPPGEIRVYQQDKEGNFFLIGEDHISPVLPEEIIKLNMGVAFDILVERTQTLYHRLSPSLYEIGWEITFKNKKTYPITINVNEEVPGDWQVTNSNFEYKKASAHILNFAVPVAAQGETQIKYTVRVKD